MAKYFLLFISKYNEYVEMIKAVLYNLKPRFLLFISFFFIHAVQNITWLPRFKLFIFMEFNLCPAKTIYCCPNTLNMVRIGFNSFRHQNVLHCE